MKFSGAPTFFFTFLLGVPALCADFESEFEAGYQTAADIKEEEGASGVVTKNRPYFFSKGILEFETGETSTLEIDGAMRGWFEPEGESELQLRSLKAAGTWEKWKLTVGFQEVAWGETFGVFIADLVNPRDQRDPFFNELDWTRVPVFTNNLELLLDPFYFQFIYTPVSRRGRLPDPGENFSVVPAGLTSPETEKYGLSDPEGGMRAGYLFDFGLDLQLFYFNHFDRYPVYEITSPTNPELNLKQERVETIGLSFTQSIDSFILRGDSLAHFNQSVPGVALQPTSSVVMWRNILGGDLITDDGWTIGGQYHMDAWDYQSGKWRNQLRAFSLRVRKTLLDEKLEPEIFLFQGLDSEDRWVQPKLTWNVTDAMKISGRLDFIQGEVGNGTLSNGFLGPFREKDRFLLWMAYLF